jgi:hypothetical protein
VAARDERNSQWHAATVDQGVGLSRQTAAGPTYRVIAWFISSLGAGRPCHSVVPPVCDGGF